MKIIKFFSYPSYRCELSNKTPTRIKYNRLSRIILPFAYTTLDANNCLGYVNLLISLLSIHIFRFKSMCRQERSDQEFTNVVRLSKPSRVGYWTGLMF